MMNLSTEIFCLQVEADAIRATLAAIYCAMDNGAEAAEAYAPAVWLMERTMDEHTEKLREIANRKEAPADGK